MGDSVSEEMLIQLSYQSKCVGVLKRWEEEEEDGDVPRKSKKEPHT